MHPNGRCVWSSGESTYTKTDEGMPYIIKVIQSVHEERVMEKFFKRSHCFFESVIASITDGLLVTDEKLRVIKANTSFYQLFQLEEESLEKATY